MPLSKITKYPEKDCLLGLWRIQETSEEEFPIYSDPIIKAEVDDMRLMVRRLERLAVYSLLKAMTGFTPRLLHRASGAPYLKDSPYHMSLSHTRGWAAVILCEDHGVGVDIEVMSERPLKALDRLCRPEETAAFRKDHMLEAAMVAFSLKESCFKLVDEHDAACFKDALTLALPAFASEGTVPVIYHSREGDKALEGCYVFEHDYVLTAAVRK